MYHLKSVFPNLSVPRRSQSLTGRPPSREMVAPQRDGPWGPRAQNKLRRSVVIAHSDTWPELRGSSSLSTKVSKPTPPRGPGHPTVTDTVPRV